MSFMVRSAELRARARASLDGIWGRSALHILLVYIVVGVPLGLINMIPFIGYLATLVVTGALTLGIYGYYMEIARGDKNVSFGTYFSGFNQFVEAFLLYLLMAIFTFLWTLLLIIPGIIAGIRYSQAYYIMRDNPGIGALEAINRSKQLMDGHKWRYFVLYLTYIGWIILGSIPFGIGLLWVYPYLLTALAHFHEDLKGRAYSTAPPPLDSPGFSG
jgi:uncharacterized membrane protein